MSRTPTLCLATGLALLATLCGCGSHEIWQRQMFAFAALSDSPSPAAQTNLMALGRVSVSPLFQSRAFTYRTAGNTYVQDPYAAFLVSPERALAEPIRAALRHDGKVGRVIEPGTGLIPSIIVEPTVNTLDGDFRDASHPIAEMTIHFIVYESGADGPGRVLLDRICAAQTPITGKTPTALMTGWETDLRKIMDDFNSEYAKANINDR